MLRVNHDYIIFIVYASFSVMFFVIQVVLILIILNNNKILKSNHTGFGSVGVAHHWRMSIDIHSVTLNTST